MKRILTLLSIVLVVLSIGLAAAGCGGSGSDDAPDGSEPGGTIEQMEQESQSATREANLRQIDSAIQAYYAENGVYPTNISQLAPYFVRGIPSDPMGGTYYITNQGGVPKAAVK